jgi:putative ABC transport system ATP-binding protein
VHAACNINSGIASCGGVRRELTVRPHVKSAELGKNGTSFMFELRALRHAYDGVDVLRIGQWRAEQGSHWLVLGPSGSGKSTLLHILAGILRPTEGHVTVARQDLGALSASELDHFRGKEIGIVLQRLHLVSSLTVLQNVLLSQYASGVGQDRARALAVLEGLDLADKPHAYPHQLSFGQAQRVAVARAIVNRPSLLLADEPTSNLDDVRCMQTLDLLESQATACGATLLIATHDQRIKSRIANHYDVQGRAA